MRIIVINCLVVFCFTSWRILALPDVIKIGGIFEPQDKHQEIAFKYAAEGINQDRRTLPKSKLHAQIESLPADDSFHASKRVCELLRSGVAAIFGPQSEKTANHVQSICDALEVPHIETRWDYKLTRDAYSINLFPHPSSLGQAYHDVISALQWKQFVLLYDSNEGLVRLQSLLKNKDWKVTIRQLEDGDDWRPLLKHIKKTQETKIVLDVAQDKIFPVLNQALQIGLMSDYHSYFITSLDLHLVDLKNFWHSGTNITALRMIDPEKPEVKKVVEDWRMGELRYGEQLDPNYSNITTESALMYDAVRLFARALDDLDRSKEVDITPLYCVGDKTWQHGSSLVNNMKWYGSTRRSEASPTAYPGQLPPYGSEAKYSMGVDGMNSISLNNAYGTMQGSERNPYRFPGGIYGNFSSVPNLEDVQVFGLTGLIKFDTEGFRTDFLLEIVELEKDIGLTKVGTWTEKGKANYTRNFIHSSEKISLNLKNKTMIVTIALTAPYTMLTESSHSLTGNDRYEGFCIDLIHDVSKELGFKYTFKEVSDGNYGSKKDGEWDGMIRELLDHEADLGIVDFTITYVRAEAVDFSMPFMNLGISIIYKKPQKKAPSLFSFMSPFSIDVWIYMATAYLGVSVLLFILAR